MKLRPLFPKIMTAALALVLLALSASCVYPGYWRPGPWRGPGYYHRW